MLSGVGAMFNHNFIQRNFFPVWFSYTHALIPGFATFFSSSQRRSFALNAIGILQAMFLMEKQSANIKNRSTTVCTLHTSIYSFCTLDKRNKPLCHPSIKRLTSTRQASNLQPIPWSTEAAYQRHNEWTFDQVIKLIKIKLATQLRLLISRTASNRPRRTR